MGLLSRCTPEQLAGIRDACERDFLAFVALMFRARTGMVFRVNRHHERIADALMAVYRGEVRNLLINTPPGSSKTELAVIAFMAWCFARDPHCRFLHLSYSDDLASLNSTSAREILETEGQRNVAPAERDRGCFRAGCGHFQGRFVRSDGHPRRVRSDHRKRDLHGRKRGGRKTLPLRSRA